MDNEYNPSLDSSPDGSRLLSKLVQGLRSGSRQEQFESLLSFVAFFDHFSLPTTLQAGFLKLAELFHDGDNVHRYYINRVFERSKHHLHVLNGKDEIISAPNASS